MKNIEVRGARTHNLKDISLTIPRDKLVVITGLSGSGKSSLAFDTLYAEGQRRYVESLSAYARQFLSLMEKPDVDHIEGLSPAISIEQKSTSHNPRSTVGTITEIYDYLRLLYARVGEPRCPEHGQALTAQTISQMVDKVLALEEGTKVMLLAPIVQDRKGEHVKLLDNLAAQGFIRARIDGEVCDLSDPPTLELQKKHTIEVVVDRIKVREDIQLRLSESFETTLTLTSGTAKVAFMDEPDREELIFSANFACPHCGYSMQELEPRLFSFNNPAGACQTCDGLGIEQYFDSTRVIANAELSLADGAVRGWDKRNFYYFQMLQALDTKQQKAWHTYWLNNPVNAWVGGNKSADKAYFTIEDQALTYLTPIAADELDAFNVMVQELVNYRFSLYEQRLSNIASDDAFGAGNTIQDAANSIPYFSDLKIACGHFRTSSHETEEVEQIALPEKYGTLDPAKHFIARAMGNSMNGGKRPIIDGDYLLLEFITPESAGSISNQIVAIERQNTSGDDQYLLRSIKKIAQGQYELIAQNSDYEPMLTTGDMTPFARLKDVIDPMDLHLHQSFMRADIPALFGLEFNKGAWEAGHVCPKDHDDQFLLVTLNKQGKNADHQYHDYFEGGETFHWQSQNMTAPTGGKGQRLINHQANGSKLHLFVRKNKLEAKKAAPFFYCGTANYVSHKGEKPMSVITGLDYELSEYLKLEFMG